MHVTKSYYYKISNIRYVNDSLLTVNVTSKDIVVGASVFQYHALMYDCGHGIKLTSCMMSNRMDSIVVLM